REFADLSPRVASLYRRCLLVVRTQVDSGGAVLAANDADIIKFARDTYSYMWPRDAALAVYAMDQAGYVDLPRRFFELCARIVTREGYFRHKYTPAGDPGSSWHPWVDPTGKPQYPIQEDETGLVLFAQQYGEIKPADRYQETAEGIKQVSRRYRFHAELNRFVRRIYRRPDGTTARDLTIDSSVYGLWYFGMLPADDPQIVSTMKAVYDRLWCKTEVGGIARYENDWYYQVSQDIDNVPGNPWFICTMWDGQWLVNRTASV